MSNFIPVEADGVPFYIQVMPAEGQTGIKQRSRDTLTEKLTKDDFKQMIRQAVMPACQTFVDVWQELNQPLTAESAEVEFNLGFTASGSAVIVQASGQASFKVKVSWKFSQFPFEPIDRSPFENIGVGGGGNPVLIPPTEDVGTGGGGNPVLIPPTEDVGTRGGGNPVFIPPT